MRGVFKREKKLFKLLNLHWSKHGETKPISEDLSLPRSSLNLYKVKQCGIDVGKLYLTVVTVFSSSIYNHS